MSHQPQPTPPFAPAAAFARSRETAPAYWMLGILWLVLVDGRDTGGSYSVIEQLTPAGSGPRLLHVHPIDEWFYVVEGEMTAEVGGQTIVGSAGQQPARGDSLMKKIGIFLLFLPAAMLVSGLFGIIHDQISYSVSNEYFTKFKFIQFGLLDVNLPDRFRAGVVGFLASWWMGIPLGILCGLAGFIQRSPSLMRHALIWSLPVIATFTLAIALAGLAYGWCRTGTIDLPSYRGWFIPADVNELRRFLCAGYMHNAAYLGGGLSVPAAWLFHLIFRARNSKQPTSTSSPTRP